MASFTRFDFSGSGHPSTRPTVGFKQGNILWLVDGLQGMAEGDKRAVLPHFAGLPAIVGAYPWHTQDLIRDVYAPHMAEYGLGDLTSEEQRLILRRLAHWFSMDPADLDLATYVLTELADLARLPLGVAAIYASVMNHRSSPVHVMQTAIAEYFSRAGLDQPRFEREWVWSSPALRSLTQAADIYLSDWTRYGDEYALSKTRFEQTLEADWHYSWQNVLATRLVATVPYGNQAGDQYALAPWNDDILAFCAACRNSDRSKAQDLPPRLSHVYTQLEMFCDTVREEEGQL